MKLKKEDIYIDLRGKSKEELTDLWQLLDKYGEQQVSDSLGGFLIASEEWSDYYYNYTKKIGWMLSYETFKEEVTIEQLKEILKPDLKTKLEKAKKDVERFESLIMEENKPKVDDWCIFWDDDYKLNVYISKLRYINICHTTDYKYHTHESYYKNCKKITNPELIKLLEDESK